jgi:PEP-CTERM motif
MVPGTLCVRRYAIYNHSGMKLILGLYLAIFAAQTLPAASIFDVSSNIRTSITTGDTLAFQVLSSNFAPNALSFGQSIYPTVVTFALVTAPITGAVTGAGDFEATLQSADGSVSIAFGSPLAFTNGSLQSSGYAGAVSTLNGYLNLSPLLSEALFSASPVLTLTYAGPDITLGLDPYTLRQELYVSLGSGPLTVGALHGPVTLQTPDLPTFMPSSVNEGGPTLQTGGLSVDSPVPEPGSGLLSFGGGALLVTVSWLIRGGRNRRNRIARETSTVCNPSTHSDTI